MQFVATLKVCSVSDIVNCFDSIKVANLGANRSHVSYCPHFRLRSPTLVEPLTTYMCITNQKSARREISSGANYLSIWYRLWILWILVEIGLTFLEERVLTLLSLFCKVVKQRCVSCKLLKSNLTIQIGIHTELKHA